MLTALAGDDLATARRRAVARSAEDARRVSPVHHALDQFAELAHTAEAAARRMARTA